MKNRFLLLLLLALSNICTAQVREFYKTTVNATILLYKKTNGQLKSHGTAFILYNYDNNSDETILVTCEHVTHHDTLVAAIPATDSVKKLLLKNNQDKISFVANGVMQTIRFDGTNLLFSIPVELNNNYYRHAYLDLATIFCNLPTSLVNTNNETLPLTNMKRLPRSLISQKNEMFAGQEITFIGFPSGIGTQNGFYGTKMYRDTRTNPLFRKGIISWTSDNADMFLVDGFSYSGNSGSPVFSIPGEGSGGKFIGMVIGHLNSEVEIDNIIMDTVSKEFKPQKTYIDVNNGLAQCIPSYIIYDFAAEAVKNRNSLLNQRKTKS